MSLFNQYDIQQIARNASSNPDLAPFSAIALAYLDIVNSNSDGWAYWKPARKSASRFLSILDKLSNPRYTHQYDRNPKPTTSDLRKALAPMKSLLTKRNLPQLPKP